MRQIAEALRDRGLRVCLDEWELVPGQRWIRALESYLKKSRSIAVCFGQHGLGRWEEPEMEGALIESVRRGVPVIPVALPEAPTNLKLPLFLETYTWMDLRAGLTPDRLDRLVWGIKGKKPNPVPAVAKRSAKMFDVFLSHNRADKPAVRQIAEALRNRGLRVWLDEQELVPGRPWIPELERQIQTVQTVAVFVGENGLGPWEQPEVEVALMEGVGRGVPIIPVPLPGAPADLKLPLFLKRYTWVDLRGGITSEGLDRLAWGITGEQPKSNSLLPDKKNPPLIFVSYSHKDKRWKDNLLIHLEVFQEEGRLQVWSDRNIEAGAGWLTEIQTAMDSSRVAVLLISAHFLNSKFIRSQEIPRLLRRRAEEGMVVFPIIIGSCLWRKIDWLASLQVRPRDGRPLSSRRGDRVDAELSAIVEEILDVLNL